MGVCCLRVFLLNTVVLCLCCFVAKIILHILFSQMFFKPAVDNIRENSGSDAVSDDAIIMLSAQMLEEVRDIFVLILSI